MELPHLYANMMPSEQKKRVYQVLVQMDIIHRSNHFPQQLSGGQQQRVAIGRAVVMQPDLILADEPTGNLDSQNGTAVMHLLQAWNQAGTTIIMVSHSPADAT